jgi:hypothetical protein
MMNNKKHDNDDNQKTPEDHPNKDGNGNPPIKEPPPEQDGGKDLTIDFELPPAKPGDNESR